jgi:hypothetical protein
LIISHLIFYFPTLKEKQIVQQKWQGVGIIQMEEALVP